MEPFSKQSNGIPRAASTWQAVIPDEPAPTMQTFSELATQPILFLGSAGPLEPPAAFAA